MPNAPLRVAVTVDFEPDCPPYLSSTFRGIEQGAPRLLELFRAERVAATYFSTSEVADRYPEAVRALVDAGHELGCHGVTHTAFDRMDERTARWEIEHSARVLREFASVDSFRAPYLRFPEPFVRLLEGSGFGIDSSLAKYKRSYRAARLPTTLRRIPASMTSSVLRLPAIVRDPWLARLAGSRRALRAPVGVRRSPARAAAAGLSLSHRRRRARLPARRDRVVPRTRRGIPDDARARRVSVPVAGAPSVGGGLGRVIRVGLVLALAAAFFLAVRTLDPTRARDAIATARGVWVAAAALCYLAILPLWAWQWHLLAPAGRSQTFSRMLRVVTTTSGVLNTTPLLVGEATGVVLLVTLAGLERTAALSVLAMDQLLVGIAKLGVLATAAARRSLPDWMARGALGLIVLVAALASSCCSARRVASGEPDRRRTPIALRGAVAPAPCATDWRDHFARASDSTGAAALRRVAVAGRWRSRS